MFDKIKDIFNPKPLNYYTPSYIIEENYKLPRSACVPPADVDIEELTLTPDIGDVIGTVNAIINNNTFSSVKKNNEIKAVSPTMISPFETKGLLEKRLSDKVDKLEKENIELKEEVKRLNDLVEYWKIAKDADEEETTTMYLGDGSTYEERIVRRRN